MKAAGNRGKIVGRVGELKRNSRRGKFNKKRRETGVFLAQHPRKMYLPQIKNHKDNMFSSWERKKKCNKNRHDYYKPDAAAVHRDTVKKKSMQEEKKNKRHS